MLIQAYYSHSLVGAALLAGVAALAVSPAWGPRARAVIAGVVFSHFILDLVVHRPDLPILPGHAAGLPLLGFGLWRIPVASALVELALCLVGTALYLRTAKAEASAGTPAARRRALLAPAVTGVLLLALLGADFFGAPMAVTLLLMLLLILLCGFLDARRAAPRTG